MRRARPWSSSWSRRRERVRGTAPPESGLEWVRWESTLRVARRSPPSCGRPRSIATSTWTTRCSRSRCGISSRTPGSTSVTRARSPAPGDFVTTEIGTRPVMMVRGEDGTIRVLHNRCPHKGTRLVTERAGNAGRHFRCPYHAWTFRTDGCVYAIPLRRGYDGTGLEERDAARGIARAGAVHCYRGFVFARLAETGIGFDEYFGESLSSLDNMVDRSPAGRLEVAGPPLRYLHRCNWKMVVENQTDACHRWSPTSPRPAPRSGSGRRCKSPRARRSRWRWRSSLPSSRATSSSRRWGIRVWPNGHGHTGGAPLHSLGLLGDPRLLRAHGGGLGRGAGTRHPRREPAQHRLLPEHHGEGADPAPSPVPAPRRRPHPRRELRVPAGGRSGPAPRANRDVQPPHQRPHLHRRARRPRDLRADAGPGSPRMRPTG